MKHPHVVLLTLLITTLMVIDGCGSAPQSAQPTASLPLATQPNPTAPPPATPTPSPSALQQAFAGNYKTRIVTVGAEWMDTDYLTMLKEFERRTGINIQYSSISDELDSQLASEINAGKGPDVEELSSLSSLRDWAKQGKLVDISTFVDMSTLRARYDQDVLDWATVDGPHGPIVAGAWSMAFIAGVVWYPKAAFDKAGYQVPATWAELLALSDRIVKDGGTPWCIENGGGGYQGGEAARWMSEIMLRTSSPADYDKWVAGGLKFDSPQVKRAAELMSEIWFKPGYTYVKRQEINRTYWWSVMTRMMENPPRCWLFNAPSFIAGWDGQNVDTAFTSKAFGSDYGFFVLPPIEQSYGAPVTMYGHIIVMFHDRPEVRALVEYFTTGAPLEAWITSAHRFGFSLHKDAQLEWYPEAGGERAAAEVVRNANIRRFAAADWMPHELSDYFCKTLSAYVSGEIDLDAALKKIDAKAATINSMATSTATP
ncbi:MAG TPA: ABC transporter substrate-binding protein [Kouleothrix sp.]|uniref:ABC transporter substrate-binding protein n=1 Tax=Kouleothrix sp. TaxID=2779161 RepID=UPI002BAF1935|nr:ABC transporter substrate-binding protein [Kouleothrix sp.]